MRRILPVFILSYILFILISNSIYSANSISYKLIDKISFEHLTIKDGLSDNYITCILQDRNGFMWFGTKDGLNKYDGYNFTIYQPDENYSNSLADNMISALCEDKSGNIWIGTRKRGSRGNYGSGLNRFNPETERFTHFKHKPNDSLSLSSNLIISICVDDNGILWVGTNNGLNIYNEQTSTFTVYNYISDNPNSLRDNRITSIIESNSENQYQMWIGTKGGLSKLNTNLLEYKHYFHKGNNSNSLVSDDIHTLSKTRNGDIWIGTSWGLNRFEPSKEKFTLYNAEPDIPNSISGNQISSIMEDRSGALWIGTKNNGLNKFDRKNNKFIQYKNVFQDPHSLSDDRITSIYEDRSGVIWIGTEKGGVNKFYPGKDQFAYYKHEIKNKNSLSNNLVWTICEDKSGIIWIGTNKGLNRLNPIEEEFKHYLFDPYEHNSISHNRVRYIYEYQPGILLIGTWAGGLNKFEVKNEKFYRYKHNPNDKNTISSNYVKKIIKDKNNKIWIATNDGLNEFDFENNLFKQYRHNPDNINSLSKKKIFSICESNRTNSTTLWIGTYFGGLNKFDAKKEQFTHYIHNRASSNQFTNNILAIHECDSGELWCGTSRGLIKFNPKTEKYERYDTENLQIKSVECNFIFEDTNNIIWVGTEGGLFKYDKEKNKFIYYDKNDGLPFNEVNAILEDDNGCLWIASEKCISKFNPHSELFSNYEFQNNLEKALQTASLKCANGDLIFGGMNGFVKFNPSDIKDNLNIPSIVLTDFKVFNKSVQIKNNEDENDIFMLDKHINVCNEIELSYSENVLSFEFASLDFVNPEFNKYAYKMEGIDQEWIYTDASQRIATYSHVHPGNYRFVVKGSNNDGIWNEEGTSLRIVITPPWWQSYWFNILVFLLVIGVLAFFYNLRISTLRKKARTQQEFSRQLIESQENERKRIASSLHDSHAQSLLIINNEMQQFIEDHEEHQEKLLPVSETVKESIKEIREISYNLHPHQLDRLGLKKAIESLVSKISRTTNIKFNLTIDKIDNLLDKKSEINLFRILQEGINNIIKHSGADEAKIIIQKNREYLKITISDNGQGFDEKKMTSAKKGLGLTGMEERANLMGGSLKIKSNPIEGTVVFLKLPY